MTVDHNGFKAATEFPPRDLCRVEIKTGPLDLPRITSRVRGDAILNQVGLP